MNHRRRYLLKLVNKHGRTYTGVESLVVTSGSLQCSFGNDGTFTAPFLVRLRLTPPDSFTRDSPIASFAQSRSSCALRVASFCCACADTYADIQFPSSQVSSFCYYFCICYKIYIFVLSTLSVLYHLALHCIPADVLWA